MESIKEECYYCNGLDSAWANVGLNGGYKGFKCRVCKQCGHVLLFIGDNAGKIDPVKISKSLYSHFGFK